MFVKESTDCWRRREAKRGEAKRRENSESVSGGSDGIRMPAGRKMEPGTWNLGKVERVRSACRWVSAALRRGAGVQVLQG